MDLNKRTVIAHRGASALVEHENTLEAFEKAIELKVPIMEFDVRITKDKVLVSYHDETIGKYKIRDMTYNELINYSLSKGFIVPRLSEILNISKGKIVLDIELKESGYEEDVIKEINKTIDHDGFIIKSFIDETIIKIKKIDPKIKTGLLLGVDVPKHGVVTRLFEIFPLGRIIKTKPDFIAPHYELLRWGFIYRMRLLKLPIFVWTVNDENKMKNLFNKGITGIITDRPDIALRYIKNWE